MKKTLLVITLSTVLTACGSSGGSSNTGSVANDTGKHITPIENPKENPVLKDVKDMNKFTLNGKTIELIPSFIHSGGFYKTQDKNSARNISGNKYKETRFGVLIPDYNEEPIAISQGNVTPVDNMPKNIQVKYLGDFVNYSKNKKRFETGSIDVNVDFGTKEIEVDVFDNKHIEKYGDTMTGKVSGNQFTFDEGKGHGTFYGSQASELSGVHKSENSVTVFGAKKQ